MKRMNVPALTEAIIILGLCAVTVREGLRLIIYKVPHATYDAVGPGLYIAIIGFGLLAASVFHVAGSLRAAPAKQAAGREKMDFHVVSTVADFVLYTLLITIVGYLAATVIFFLIQFRIEGIKSWPAIVVTSLALSGAYYLLFVVLSGIVFPKNLLFG
jgi:hypothetical protein